MMGAAEARERHELPGAGVLTAAVAYVLLVLVLLIRPTGLLKGRV